MSLDIIEFLGEDLVVSSTLTEKAKNIFETQLGSLEYALDFGSDLDYFLQDDIIFQNASFKAYLLQRLAENSIDVTSVIELIDSFIGQYTFNIKSKETESLVQ